MIRGVVFEAGLSAEGPCIQALFGPHRRDGVPLGTCASIATFQEHDGSKSDHDDLGLDDRGPSDTFVVKHSTKRRIALEGFGETEIEQLRSEFGIATRGSGRPDYYRSEAERSLVGYVRSRPRIAERFAGATSHLGDWFGCALENAPGSRPALGFH